MRLFLHIGYKGTHYHGWQRQVNVSSIQQTIEENLSKMLGQTMTVVGCGRTDAGVHASQYFLHFDLPEAVDYDLVFRLNKMLPDDIAIFESIPIAPNAHVQLDATDRTYDYFLHFKKDPFLKDLSSYYDVPEIDIKKMSTAVAMIPAYQNFRSFCKRPDIYKHTNCDIKSTNLFLSEDKTRMRFEITSNRFIRGMIRLLVAQLIDIGKGRLELEEWKKYLSAEKELPFKNFAYPQGLFLSKVEYPYLSRDDGSLFSQEVGNLWLEV